jgi:hypothetical protein
MRGGAILARAEMWPAATGQHRRCRRRGDRRERGRGRWRASTAGGAATELGAAAGQWAAGRRRRDWLQTAAAATGREKMERA